MNNMIDTIIQEINQASRRMCTNQLPAKYYRAIGTRKAEEIIRKHLNDGWIPTKKRFPTKEECENSWFWIMLKNSSEPEIAKCRWVECEDDHGNDDSFSEFFIDKEPEIYTPSKSLILAWVPVYVPEPYRPEKA